MPWGKWNGNIPKFIECSKSSSKRKVYSATGLSQERKKKPQTNNLFLHLKELEKEEQIKPKVSRRKGNKRLEQK